MDITSIAKNSSSPSDSAGATLGTAQFPAGKIKEDEYFGKVETYRKNIVIKLPVELPPERIANITLKVISQGCADAGVCYPPLTQTAQAHAAAAASRKPEPGSGGLAALTSLAGMGNGQQDEFLEPDQAFKLAVTAKDGQTLVASFTPAESYYLYRDKIKFTLKNAAGASIANIELPKGETKTDPNFGATEVYHHPFQATDPSSGRERETHPASQLPGLQRKRRVLSAHQQNLRTHPATQGAHPNAPPACRTAPTPAPDNAAEHEEKSESSRIADLLKGGSFWLVVASFFGFGLLLALTPCVFPMIPILSGIIVGQGQSTHPTTRLRPLAGLRTGDGDYARERGVGLRLPR